MVWKSGSYAQLGLLRTSEFYVNLGNLETAASGPTSADLANRSWYNWYINNCKTKKCEKILE